MIWNLHRGYALSTTNNGDLKVVVALQNTNTLVLYVCGKDFPKQTASIQINGFDIGSVKTLRRFRPDDYSNTRKVAPYKEERAPFSIDYTSNKLLFEINANGKYEIFKVILTKK